ncbi:aldehyde dehydrogenase family protein [Agrococcus carbonis]|uniref:aldehyde dehydrogenase (NAD(+)) n=1 Tax=Agrococcus carbonis TaxID=684552 RepID=A0A1H1NIK1_9MICO|nr:aldehyde dehydrogenase family protein [Agrococcus carbonis]SDR98826.1 geranial dehydrogenase [Agrococcus carbonis]
METTKLYIDGAWREPSTDARGTTVDANTGQPIGSYPVGGPADIDRAVTAARRALDDQAGWGGSTPAERIAIMRRFADAIERRRDAIGALIAAEVGTPLERATFSNADAATGLLRFYADVLERTEIEDLRPAGRGHSLVRREPIGVVAMIAPWNFPLSTLFFKIGPAIAAGCTAVIKPASVTALDSFLIAEAADEAGVPAGVLNFVPCDRATGDHLVAHPGIDKVAFTGSTEVGRRIGRIAGEQLKEVSLELGGKSAALLLEDAPIETFIAELHDLSFSNNGQACTNNSRIIVPDALYDDVLEAIRAEVGGWTVGDSRDASTVIGPVSSAGHKASIERYYGIAAREGARTIIGGGSDSRDGFFVQPTVHGDVTPEMTVFREELFGPAVSVTRYSGDVEEGIRLVNDSEYGLSGGVFTADEQVGIEVARRLQTGTVGWNIANFDFGAPMNGRKASGVGFELGAEALTRYFHYKTIFTPVVPARIGERAPLPGARTGAAVPA